MRVKEAEFAVGRQGEVVTIYFRPFKDLTWLQFSRESQTTAEAQLLCQSIQGSMDERVQDLVRNAYNQGWSDKSKKKRKKSCFTSCINSKTWQEICW